LISRERWTFYDGFALTSRDSSWWTRDVLSSETRRLGWGGVGWAVVGSV